MTIANACLTLLLFAAYAALLVLVKHGWLLSFDDTLLHLPRLSSDLSQLRGGVKLLQAVNDLTALGGLTVLFSLVAIVAGFLWVSGNWRSAIAVILSVVSGWIMSAMMKVLINRDRPEIVPHLVPVHDPSFPSGHALVAAVTYLTLGALLAANQQKKAVKVYVMAIAVLITFLVGTSRIFLGVHFPTDVLAGWLFGSAWALLCVMLMRRFM